MQPSLLRSPTLFPITYVRESRFLAQGIKAISVLGSTPHLRRLHFPKQARIRPDVQRRFPFEKFGNQDLCLQTRAITELRVGIGSLCNDMRPGSADPFAGQRRLLERAYP